MIALLRLTKCEACSRNMHILRTGNEGTVMNGVGVSFYLCTPEKLFSKLYTRPHSLSTKSFFTMQARSVNVCFWNMTVEITVKR